MITISLCLIVKNEEQVLDRCLNSVKDVVDEIVIVDTGSTDHTLGIATKYEARIFHFDWIDDFSAQGTIRSLMRRRSISYGWMRMIGRTSRSGKVQGTQTKFGPGGGLRMHGLLPCLRSVGEAHGSC